MSARDGPSRSSAVPELAVRGHHAEVAHGAEGTLRLQIGAVQGPAVVLREHVRERDAPGGARPVLPPHVGEHHPRLVLSLHAHVSAPVLVVEEVVDVVVAAREQQRRAVEETGGVVELRTSPLDRGVDDMRAVKEGGLVFPAPPARFDPEAHLMQYVVRLLVYAGDVEDVLAAHARQAAHAAGGVARRRAAQHAGRIASAGDVVRSIHVEPANQLRAAAAAALRFACWFQSIEKAANCAHRNGG